MSGAGEGEVGAIERMEGKYYMMYGTGGLTHEGAIAGGHLHRLPANPAGLEPPNERTEMDLLHLTQAAKSSPQAKATEALALRMAGENAWGYVRIAGELKKLGHKVSPSYVRDLLKKHGLPPSPDRKGLSWKQFIQTSLEVTWAADFFTGEVWTYSGLVTYYTLFFIHLGTRRVQFAGCTPHPEARWMQQ